MRFLLTIQYLGTRYAGWQTQTNAVAIQQVMEEALASMCHAAVRLHGAGRTDAGVHAAAQRAHVDLPISIPARGLVLGLNDLLPPDIRIVAAEAVADDFHARFSATAKTYVYRIWNDAVHDVFQRETSAHVTAKLDVGTMREAAARLIGTHDFRAFTVSDPEVATTVRTLTRLDVEKDGAEIRITATADGFLRYMVRRIAGSLIEAGRGKLSAADVAGSLEPTFAEARWTAPANGLVLSAVSYAS